MRPSLWACKRDSPISPSILFIFSFFLFPGLLEKKKKKKKLDITYFFLSRFFFFFPLFTILQDSASIEH